MQNWPRNSIPLRPLILGLYAVVLVEAGECDMAMAEVQAALAIEPDHFFAYGQKGSAAACLGDTATAFEVWKRFSSGWSDEVVARIDSVFQASGPAAATRVTLDVNNEVFSKGGQISFTGQANRHMELREYEQSHRKACTWLMMCTILICHISPLRACMKQ